MSIETTQLLAGFGLFALGIIVGIFFQRNATRDSRKVTRLEQKLAETEDKFTRYQADVSSHFMETARKVQTLNKSYKEVHDQLAAGASKLCESGEMEEFLSLNFATQSNASHRGHTLEVSEDGFAPPMDYAPKDKPEAEGTLSERFGFENTHFKENSADSESGKEPAQQVKN